MKKYGLAFATFLLAMLIGSTLVQARSDGQISIKRLHPTFKEHERVHSYQLSPDEATVVYYAGDYSKNSYALYAVPRRATAAPILLSRDQDTGRIGNYAITPESQSVIYNTGAALIKVGLTGTDAHTITLPLSNTSPLVKETIGGFWIAADQQTLVYEISTYPATYEKLISMKLDGSAPIELITKTKALAVEQVTAERVVYAGAMPQGPYVTRLFSIAVHGGQPISLTAGLSDSQIVEQLPQISPDGQTVVFKVRDINDQSVQTLYEAAVDGSSLVRLSDPAHTAVRFMYQSPDSQSIVYANQVEPLALEQADLFRVARGGGPATRLTGAARPSYFDIRYTLEITPDSQHVVFVARTADGYQLYKAALSGGTPTPLSPLEAGYLQFVIAQGGRSVVYARPNSSNTADSLYRVPLSGGQATPLSTSLGSTSNIQQMQVSADGNTLVAIQHGSERHTAYAFDLRYGTAKQLNPAPFTDLFFVAENTYRLTSSGDVIALAEVIGSPAQEELFITIRDDQPIPVFLPLLQR
jgi:Tol biopolymer transport system component